MQKVDANDIITQYRQLTSDLQYENMLLKAEIMQIQRGKGGENKNNKATLK
ncbi:hypothetical protein [Lactobacillus delbrueckii]|uniref:hypothetical protein n=1 Tax=Lactobacillus delbrueckii TaxID=1584 RepID=UPI003A8869F0